ncbi:MAG: hypothetical protein ACMUIP_16970 [bacterium]
MNNYCDVIADENAFWNREEAFDIIHIHWIEGLVYWRLPPSEIELIHLEEVLMYWKKRAKIVVTRHNIYPHYRERIMERRLFDLVYKYADGVIHMGEYSKNEYCARYKNIIAHDTQIHTVIRHGMYQSYPNTIFREEARRRLGIAKDRFTILAFGKIRNKEEADLLLGFFKVLPIKKKTLIVPMWEYYIGSKKASSKDVCKKAAWKIISLYHRYSKKYLFEKRFIEDSDIQLYVNAADVMIIQRKKGLNSGCIILGFSFSKVVVGPDVGNIGEILRATGNPVFDPDDFQSISRAVLQAREMAALGKGKSNYEYACRCWDNAILSKQHFNFYQRVIKGA